MLNKRILRITFIFYFILLAWLILFKGNVAQYCLKYHKICLIPFADQSSYGSKLAKYICDIGNFVLFIPAGIYFCLFFRNNKSYVRILSAIGLTFALSLFFEVMQYVLVIGYSSITDIIENTIGGIIGIIIYEPLKNLVSNETINKINKYTLFVIIPLGVFVIINTIIHIDLYL